MKWKTLGRIARLAAYVVVPGAAGYAAYRYVVRPWLDGRAAKGRELEELPAGDKPTPDEHSVSESHQSTESRKVP